MPRNELFILQTLSKRPLNLYSPIEIERIKQNSVEKIFDLIFRHNKVIVTMWQEKRQLRDANKRPFWNLWK